MLTITSLFEKHRENFSEALKEDYELPLREFYNIDTNSIRQILLSLYLYQKKKGAVIEKEPAISSFYDCQLNIKKPSWHKTAQTNFNKEYDLSSEDALYEYNPELYHAKGELGRFFKSLEGFTLKKLNDEFISSITFPGYETDQLVNVKKGIKKEKAIDFFKMIDELEYSELLDNILYKVHLSKEEQPIEIDQLSEGQNQISLVLGLKELFRDTETLFLFDEPDTYLHPEWQIKLMKELKQLNKNDHLIVTTHSTIALNQITIENIVKIENGKVSLWSNEKSFGAKPEHLLEQIQDVENFLPQEILSISDKLFELIETDYKKAKSMVKELSKKVGENHPDVIKANSLIELKELLD